MEKDFNTPPPRKSKKFKIFFPFFFGRRNKIRNLILRE